jgi:hypothetical protein
MLKCVSPIKFAYGGACEFKIKPIFATAPAAYKKIELASKVVKIYSKLIILLP